MIGIPYAFGEVTSEGLLETCPVCAAKILTPLAEFNETGERRDETLPTPYQLHWLVCHEGEADA